MGWYGDYRYEVEVAKGCHGDAFAPIVSRHRSLGAALDKARQCDRYTAIDVETGQRWTIPQQHAPQGRWGRYGRGITRRQARGLGWPL